MVNNYNCEVNALYDIHHESSFVRETVDHVSGYLLPSLQPIDPGIHDLNVFIGKLKPTYRKLKNNPQFLPAKQVRAMKPKMPHPDLLRRISVVLVMYWHVSRC
jgi:hypothetical protein